MRSASSPQVANAAPEVFQRWSAASATVGIEQEKLADILKDVNDRVGDFLQTGGGPMADFFENIAPPSGRDSRSVRPGSRVRRRCSSMSIALSARASANRR